MENDLLNKLYRLLKLIEWDGQYGDLYGKRKAEAHAIVCGLIADQPGGNATCEEDWSKDEWE